MPISRGITKQADRLTTGCSGRRSAPPLNQSVIDSTVCRSFHSGHFRADRLRQLRVGDRPFAET